MIVRQTPASLVGSGTPSFFLAYSKDFPHISALYCSETWNPNLSLAFSSKGAELRTLHTENKAGRSFSGTCLRLKFMYFSVVGILFTYPLSNFDSCSSICRFKFNFSSRSLGNQLLTLITPRLAT